ncbi:hypothetical protein LCGC14_2945790, partial [marine sediment metagenome]
STVREIEGSGQNRIKHRKTCTKCLKRKRLKSKANKINHFFKIKFKKLAY